ncbi:SGNH/GDSL hydrolase family protein [Bacteroides sp. 224]|uniref:SGNH/GDSL hydrolase family protein n=1 Tax=Bacteroides sp. 224 TaxID=2302936 RepID=UPI001D20B3AB|nr:SGNH/GDSL hydrolase family protein [Bacteroides sp. 224]NDV63881.1 lipase [Bacteroides sp. 224]
MVKNNMTGDVLMKRNSLRLIGTLLFFFLGLSVAFAQDQIPVQPKPDSILIIKPLREIMKVDSVFVSITMPESFVGLNDNCIIDPNETLTPFLEHLRLLRAGASRDSIRVVHIGDSHVRGHIYPQATGARLKEDFGAVIYTDMGVNGATSLTFTHAQRIADIVNLKPDLLILSFGTNESHNKKYNQNIHYNQIDELVKLLRADLPNIPILLTTPPGAYESFRQRKRRRTYSVNPRTITAVETIFRYARNHKLAVWDLFAAVGGAERAAKNWWDSNLMRLDHIHYLPEGYVLQGELLYEAIIKEYNTYVSF